MAGSLERNGFFPVRAAQSRTRLIDRQKLVKHVISESVKAPDTLTARQQDTLNSEQQEEMAARRSWLKPNAVIRAI